MAESSGDDDAGCSSLAHGGGNGGRNRRRRHRNGYDVGDIGQIIVRFYGANSLNFVIVRVDEGNHARETGTAQVFEDGPPRGRLAE
jgi:hypothetical protein